MADLEFWKQVLDTLNSQRGVAPYNPRRYPFPANQNTDPAFLAAQEKYRMPAKVIPLGEVGAYDSVKGVGDPRGRQLTAAEMYGEPEPNDVPPWAVDMPPRAAPPSPIGPKGIGSFGTTLNTVSRFLPPWLQAGIAAGRVMWPTPTAPRSMDEAPQWSWPRQDPTPSGPQ